jgi:hypothetical protein
MAASFSSTPRSVKAIVSCGMRLARPPALLAWHYAGLIATTPLLLIEFFDWTSRAFGATLLSDVAQSFGASPSLSLLLWFELGGIMLWAAMTVIEMCLGGALLVHHLRVLSRFRRAFGAEEPPHTNANGEDVPDRQQQHALEQIFLKAAVSRSYGYSFAIVWIIRTASTVASFLFAGLQVNLTMDTAKLIHTVMIAAGVIGICQIM